ncbi:Epsin-3, clathrin recruitment and traffic between the Golgi and endosome [Coemansia sp. RSA 2049]|nr:Epsin-3, clathrin recruitment and traffic between the Golgi and endosome [Coemansia sp. RSA 2049]
MDLNKLTEISVWDVRNVYNKVRNVVLNLSEVEIKVNEATGPEPWGASGTLMREIADATHDRKNFEDIMAAIYLKINDTDPGSWRQVYKALQLVEYLVKNGSERVVDDVRSHVTIIKTLKNFHHIDANGKDQGINVRHRSKEIVDLVQNKERLREERKKAKDNRHKFEGGGGFGSYGGFSGDGYTPSVTRNDYGSDSTSNNRSYSSSRKSTPASAPVSAPSTSRNLSRQRLAEPSKPAEPVVADLFSFDDEIETPSSTDVGGSALLPVPTTSIPAPSTSQISPSIPAPTSAAKAAVSASSAVDDDWGDFQGGDNSASASVKPAGNTAGKTIDLLGDINIGLPTQPLTPTSATSPMASLAPAPAALAASTLTARTAGSISSTASTSPGKKAAFSDIWDVNSGLFSLDSLSITQKPKDRESSAGSGKQMSMNQLANKQRGSGGL